MRKQIVSIHGRAETGISRPFLCRDAGGQSWFVKRNNVTWDQLVLEWVMGHLAIDFGIPVAEFETVEIPELLAKQALAKDRRDFEPGIAFGSKRIPFGEDLGQSHIRHISDDMKIAVICFDWWTSNSDRRLTRIGGSPNLLWDPMMGSIAAIDHDRALDTEFDTGEFLKEHVFRDVRPFIEKDTVSKLRTRFESTLKHLPKIWKHIPEEWLKDETGTSRATLTPETFEAALLKPKHPVGDILPI
ncbi:MAG: hypothetical protein P1U89_17500 [Verrucomicrobiales bacterium]|nr:hypothetical protein [Verrucomicrobiales bacterium]